MFVQKSLSSARLPDMLTHTPDGASNSNNKDGGKHIPTADLKDREGDLSPGEIYFKVSLFFDSS